MRLFAAVLPPEAVLLEIRGAVDALRALPGADPGALRWTGRDGWHFTLAFYGEVDDGLVLPLTDRLARAAHRTEPFSLAMRGGGQFGRGQALWIGAEGDVEVMRILAGRAEAAARKAGVTGSGKHGHRPYKAHLSVARGRGRGPVDVRPYVEALRTFAGRTWTVDELLLVRSNLPRSGIPGEQPRYETVARWSLGAPPEEPPDVSSGTSPEE